MGRHVFIWRIYTTKYQLQGLNTELVHFGIKKSIEERGFNIEK
jgi:hypothetical protein